MVPSIEVLPTGSLKLYKSMQAFEFNPRGMIAASHGPDEGMHSYQVRSCGSGRRDGEELAFSDACPIGVSYTPILDNLICSRTLLIPFSKFSPPFFTDQRA